MQKYLLLILLAIAIPVRIKARGWDKYIPAKLPDEKK